MKFEIALLFAALSMSAATVRVTFNHDLGSLPRCTQTVAANCIDHYETGIVESNAIVSPKNIPVPATGGPKLTGITDTFLTDKTGAVVIGVIAVGKGTTGNRTVSSMLTGPLNIDGQPNPPTEGKFETIYDVAMRIIAEVTGTIAKRITVTQEK